MWRPCLPWDSRTEYEPLMQTGLWLMVRFRSLRAINKYFMDKIAKLQRFLFILLCFYGAAWSGCGTLTNPALVNKDADVGKIEIFDSALAMDIDTNARIEIIGRHYKWSEGPVWVQSKQMLLFSDVKDNKIYKWTMGDTPTVYLTPSGYTDSAVRNGENGSNGLTLDG